MNSYKVEATPKTPEVELNPDGKLYVKGRSIPENSVGFYAPIYEWLDEYAKNPQPKTEVNVHLEYFNTSSSKCILDFFKRLEAMHNSGNTQVLVKWHYEEDDEDMLEAGEDYEAILSIPFEMIEMEEED